MNKYILLLGGLNVVSLYGMDSMVSPPGQQLHQNGSLASHSSRNGTSNPGQQLSSPPLIKISPTKVFENSPMHHSKPLLKKKSLPGHRNGHGLSRKASHSINSPLFLNLANSPSRGPGILRKSSSATLSLGVSNDPSQVMKTAIESLNDNPEAGLKVFKALFDEKYNTFKTDQEKEKYIKRIWKEIDTYKEDPLRWFSMRGTVLSFIWNEPSAPISSAVVQPSKRLYQSLQNKLNVAVVQEFQNNISKPAWCDSFSIVLSTILESYDEDSPYKQSFRKDMQARLMADQKKLTKMQNELENVKKQLITIQTHTVDVLKNQKLMPSNSEIPAARDNNIWVVIQEIQMLFRSLDRAPSQDRAHISDTSISAIADDHTGDRRLLFLALLSNSCIGRKLREEQDKLRRIKEAHNKSWGKSNKVTKILAEPSLAEGSEQTVTSSVRKYIPSHFNDYEPGTLKDLFYLYINSFPFSEYDEQDLDFLKKFHKKFKLETFAQLKLFLPDLELDELISSFELNGAGDIDGSKGESTSTSSEEEK